MKTLITTVLLVLSVSAFAFTANALAAETTTKTPQQQKFADCSHKSKGLKGDEHKQFMSDCLGGKTHAKQGDAAAKGAAEKGKTEHKSTAQSEKTKACKADAKSKNLQGEDRGKFMSECLKSGD